MFWLRNKKISFLLHTLNKVLVERSFSSQNLVATNLRDRISHENVDKLMWIMVLCPKMVKFDFGPSIDKWNYEKSRIFSHPN